MSADFPKSNSERKLYVEPLPDAEFQLKVAFATLDRRHVDQHFGSARSVLIYGIGREQWAILEAIEYPEDDSRTHDRLPARIRDLSHCSAIFCNACGASAIRQLLDKGIHPVKVMEGSEIHQLLDDIRQELNGTPMGWLARSLKQLDEQPQEHCSDRLQALMDEEW
ncbi:NifB/NifX family molybdenum-iron cluster-binding protein [Shewanella sp. A32]|uniref:NifB/NifX family molybdenum-iron cluster-binding protein n=1 Tax=Shewanella sp. A32 TaxID=3031327 RepID=UPI0023B8AF88|nr:NifB/NifX family molybdenum-iron cluster-binding protein [Shewanella sp. A32]MDF0535862.1 NifB/NifX family molybdenum-iron cluster-binding protein [Shewanella sp. A32]